MASNTSLGGSLAGKSASTSKTKSETVNYLLLYENMVRHQDLEFDATHDHTMLTMERIQRLGRKSTGRVGGASAGPPALVDEEEAAPKGMLTYLQMRRCLLRLGYTWNRSLPFRPDAGSVAESYYDDDVSVLSANSASSFVSGGGGSASGMSHMSGLASTRDIIATDAQLIMLLTTLVELEEGHRAAQLALLEDGDEEEEKEEGAFSRGLFLPEFIQAYKLIIGGMQSLQTYPSHEVETREAVAKGCAALGLPATRDLSELQDLRVRSRERTLGLLKMFGPDASLYGDGAVGRQSAGEDPSTPAGRKGRDGLKAAPRGKGSAAGSQVGTKNRKGSSLKAKDGLLPRLSEEEIRTMVHSKDKALAKIMEEHESEMSVMANSMEELRVRSLQTQRLIQRRRKRTRIALAVGTLLATCGGGLWEYRRREQVRTEISAGREAERLADAGVIAALEGSVATLRAKLGDAEATIRYEEGRYTDTAKKLAARTTQLEEVEGQWRLDARELETCRVTRKELNANLSAATGHNTGIEEEVGWCRERLEGAERAMEGMEQALQKSQREQQQDAGKGAAVVVPSFASLAKEAARTGERSATGAGRPGDAEDGDEKKKKKKGGKHKPVKMEMKYNKSFRNAVILRQVYSAAAGMVVSALIHGAILLLL